ncbi:5-formyltetrahydrofolate cyclo-ligase [Kurthia massiliensis]|uniref:5-formyltetrahydrofolate cyclo-ligase n=1 Tax=Kurthia massiliensis TaxID=1033739 RepID=UPI00028900E6|nr:5-formyltetrahydrofolate cyclo-ligase [Kurthia massiliensis]
MEKKALRKQMQQQLQQLPIHTYETWSANIQTRLLTLSSIEQANVIGLTISAFPEVETRRLIEQLWQLGKQVAVPRCKPKTHEMDFYIFTSFEQLETVYMSLLEPVPSQTVRVDAFEIDVMIVPGIIFDQSGYRIGYGGGYYDRYLPTFKGETIALCFSMQMVAKVPKDSYDYPIDRIVTEKSIISCAHIRKEEQHG